MERENNQQQPVGPQLNEEELSRYAAILQHHGFDIVQKAAGNNANKKIRLVFYGDAPSVATGFGTVSRNILSYLHNTGNFEILCFGVNYFGVPHPFPFQIYPMLPNPQGDPYGREKFQQIVVNMDFDILFMLQDSFILDFIPNVMTELRRRGKKFRSLVYFPIDGTPWESWVKAMGAADACVTYTQWGKKECIKAFPEVANKLINIPHGINIKEFFPLSPDVRQRVRKQLFGPHADKFIVVNVNRNQQRKDLPRTVMAFKEFKRECPNSLLYLHCAEQDVGWHMPRVVEHLGLAVGEEVLFPKDFNVNQGFPVQWMNEMYNATDVCVSTTLGGGWELSGIEKMATNSGPCVFPDNTALTEIFADGRGFLCRSGDTPNMRIVLPMDNEIVRPLTDLHAVAKHLTRLYQDKFTGGSQLARKVSEKAYRWVVDGLQWDKHIVPQFETLIYKLYEELQQEAAGNISPAKLDSGGGWKRGEVV